MEGKVLLTGSTGFIGSRLLDLLSSMGCDVRLLARSKVNNYETVVCNLGQDRIPKLSLISIDTIFHLAGPTNDIRYRSSIPNDLYSLVNVDATVELARLAVENSVKRFVFISSVKAGGHLPSNKYSNEIDLIELDGAYAKSKREAELRLLEKGKESEMHISIIRPSMVYGPNVKSNLQLMISGIKKGWFPPLPETGNKRSMIHVDDLVRAILLVAYDDRANGEIFIATDGNSYSSREIYDSVRKALGKSTLKWSVPKVLFNIASMVSPRIKYKIKKLLESEYYSSKKIEKLGFKAQKTLSEIYEKDF